MSADIKGTLTVRVVYTGPQDGAFEAGQIRWQTRSDVVFASDEVYQAHAETMVRELRERNPNMVFHARWEGPIAL